MRPVLTAAQMREADRRTIAEIGLPGAVLMENAGAAVAREVAARWPRGRITVLCGKGNNGGDGFVAARRLRGRAPAVLLLGQASEVEGDARLHLDAYVRSGGAVMEVPDPAAWERRRLEALSADVIVDAVLGTGLEQAPRGVAAQVIADLAAVSRDGGRAVVAVDLPSGVPSDGIHFDWPAVRATLTVTFAAPKLAHVMPPATDYAGELVVEDIGIPAQVLPDGPETLWLVERADAASAFGARPARAHKGTYGHVLVLAGSPGKTGAAVMTAVAALRTGAGLVTVATAAPALSTVAAGRPEVMTEPLPWGDHGFEPAALEAALELARSRDAAVIGPGLGQAPGTRGLVRAFVRRCPVPLVVDADALNALVDAPREDLRGGLPGVLTPHPGEMARLLGDSTAGVQRHRLHSVKALAARTGAVAVLKGQRTLVSEPDGPTSVNPTGNPGMGTGGTGDVLAGVIGALLARGLTAARAARVGVYVHGLAGDLAAERMGQEGMIAGDVIDALPAAILSLADAADS